MGEPNDRWQRYRNKEIAGRVLAEGIREHYADLFLLYPDAHNKDNEALRNFFSTHTKVGENTLNYIVLTFKTICDLAELSINEEEYKNGKSISEEDTQTLTNIIHSEKLGHGYTLNINIQLTLPGDAEKRNIRCIL